MFLFLVRFQVRFIGGLVVTIITRILHQLVHSFLVNVQVLIACKFFATLPAQKTLSFAFVRIQGFFRVEDLLLLCYLFILHRSGDIVIAALVILVTVGLLVVPFQIAGETGLVRTGQAAVADSLMDGTTVCS